MNKKYLIISILLAFIVLLGSSSVFAEDTTNETQLQQDDNIDNIIQKDASSEKISQDEISQEEIIKNETTTAKSETVTPDLNSQSIQEKINGLSDGDTLNFEAGEYKNISIYVDKSITINGNGAILTGYDTPSKDNTPEKVYKSQLDGGYGITNFATLFIINTTHVTLNGLTFVGSANSGPVLSSALVYAYNAGNLNIYNNTFDGSCTGLYMNTCPDGNVYNNTVKNQASTGILNFGSARTVIENNIVTNAANHGIDARHVSGPNVKVINNTVIGSKEGIYLMHSSGHIATSNTIINCTISSITCYGSKNIRIYNNKLQKSRIGILLASGYANITIEENDYQLYRLPMPPIFNYYVAEAKSDYQSADGAMGTYTDITLNGPNYSQNSEIPAVSEKIIDYNALLTPTGELRDIADGATSAEIQTILNSLNDGDAIRFAENGEYYNISIYTTKNIKIIGNNATLYGLEIANMSDMPSEIKSLGIIYLAVLYSANNTNVAISDLNIVSRYPDHKLSVGGTATNEYKTAGIYAMKSENITVTNCRIDGASFGIMLHFMAQVGGCANAIVTNNYISNQFTYGILNFGSKASYIAHNTIVNAKWHGIDVRHQMGPNVIVYNNTITGSYEGIYLMHSHGHKVYNNTIINSKTSSITVYGSVGSNVNNIYVFNNILQGSRIGILLGGGNQNVTIGENTYTLDAQRSGDKPGFGLYLVQTPDSYSDADNVPGTYSDQAEISITVDNIKSGEDLKITLKDSNGNAVANIGGTININGNTYEFTTDSSGVGTVKTSLNPGNYSAIINTISNFDYSSGYLETTVEVSKITPDTVKLATSLTAAGKSVYVKAIAKGYSYQVTLKDANGKALAGKQITVTFNGKSYKATTNSKGIATVKLTASKAGTQKATIKFAGDSSYKASTKTTTIKISKEASKLTASAKSFKAKVKTKKYTVTLKSKAGKAIAKAKVTLKVKGKTYKATTNSKGKATFKMTKLTKKGNYSAVVKFAGNSYFSGKTVKPKITIKK